MPILVAGYSYIKENYFNTFNFYREKDKVFFLLPNVWKAKGGKIVFHPPDRPNVFKTRAFFYHSHYSLIGGILKGWMPLFPFFLARRKFRIAYSPSEPILLTTLYQGIWSKIFGLKHVIFTWENVSYKDKFHGLNGFIKKIILKLNLVFCDGVICGNKKSKNIFAKLTDKPIETIPLSGVDTNYFSPKRDEGTLAKYNLGGKTVFLFAGAIGYRKGIHLIVEAFKKVLGDVPSTHLVLVGSGEYEDELKLQIASYKLENFVTFIPWLDKAGLKSIMSVSDVFLYPSLSFGGWEEQFGYSMAEASLMELPVISTRSGSIEELVVSGQTGILVEPENVEQLAEAMARLANNPDLRKELGKDGRKFISESYGYKIVADKFYKFFQSI